MVGAPPTRNSLGATKDMTMPAFVTASASALNRERSEAALKIANLHPKNTAFKLMKILGAKVLECRSKMEDSVRGQYFALVPEDQREKFHQSITELVSAIEAADDMLTYCLLTFDGGFSVVCDTASVDTRNNLTGDKLKAYNRLKRDNKEKHSALQDRKTAYSVPGTSYARNYANKDYSGGGYNSGGYVHNRGMFQHRGYNGGGGFGRGSSRGGGMQRGGGRQNMFPGNCNKCSGKRIVINVKLI